LKGVLMAVYEYKCSKCGNVFEEDHNITSETEISKCPKCENEAKKLISLSSFTISGYASINGYAKGNVKR